MNEQIGRTVPNFSVQLSPTPRGARLARLLTTEQLRSWGLPLDPAAHIAAEPAANAATHGRGDHLPQVRDSRRPTPNRDAGSSSWRHWPTAGA